MDWSALLRTGRGRVGIAGVAAVLLVGTAITVTRHDGGRPTTADAAATADAGAPLEDPTPPQAQLEWPDDFNHYVVQLSTTDVAGTPATRPAPASTDAPAIVATTAAGPAVTRGTTPFPTATGTAVTYEIHHLDGAVETVQLTASAFYVAVPPADVAAAAGRLGDDDRIVQDGAGRWWVLTIGQPLRLREIAGQLAALSAPEAAATTAAPPTAATSTIVRGAAKAVGPHVPSIDPLLADLDTVAVQYLGQGTAALTTRATLDDVRRLPGVSGVAEDALFDLGSTNDPYYASQWNLENDGTTAQAGGYPSVAGADARIPAAWQKSTGAGQVVAVIDAGTNIAHEDLKHQLWHNPGEICGNGVDDDANGYADDCDGWDFGGSDGDPRPDVTQTTTFDHGSHVAGIIAAEANNAAGMAGVAPGAKIMALKVANGDLLSLGRVATAIRYAADNGATVINMSLATGGVSTPRTSVTALEAAVAYAVDKGVVIVAGAGNNATNLTGTVGIWPAGFAAFYPQVLAVGSTAPTGKRSNFSNWGGPTTIFAPGSAIMSTYGGSGYGRMSGTSMASPHVAGAVAVVLASGMATPATVVERLVSTGTATTDGTPSLDLANAVGVPPALADVTYGGLDALVPDEAAPIDLTISSSTPAADVAVRVSVAALAETQVMALENLDVATADDAGTLPHRYTDQTGQLADIDVRDHDALNGAGYHVALTTAFPAGTYALVTELVDKTTDLRIGRPSAVYFRVGPDDQPPGSTVPTTPTTVSPPTTDTTSVPPITPPPTTPQPTTPATTVPPGTTAAPPQTSTPQTSTPQPTTPQPTTPQPTTPQPTTPTTPTTPATTAPPPQPTQPPTTPRPTTPTTPATTAPPPQPTQPPTTAPHVDQWSFASVSPATSGIEGGTWVSIYGAFPTGADLMVWFGQTVVATRSYDGYSATLRTPKQSQPGVVSVSVMFRVNGANVSLTLPNAFTFTGSPSTTTPDGTTVPTTPPQPTTPTTPAPPQTTTGTTSAPTVPPTPTSSGPRPPTTVSPPPGSTNPTTPPTSTPGTTGATTAPPPTTVPRGGLGWASGPLLRRPATDGSALTRLNRAAFTGGRCTEPACTGTAL